MNEQISPAENPVEQTATPNQAREVIGIDPTTYDRVVQYLSNKPWGEVATIMASLSQAIKVQING